jgi:membrane carboxypeptidase/penicillin-binding protein
VGYTPDLVAGVWVGFDDRQPLGYGEEGARSAVPDVDEFMRDYVRARRPAGDRVRAARRGHRGAHRPRDGAAPARAAAG